MTHARTPHFGALSDARSRALVARNNVGRFAYSFRDRVDIRPLHYVYDAGWIFGRTSVGSKLTMLAHQPWCAFEVDEVRGVLDWDSVVGHGHFEILDPETGSPDRYARALELLERLVPGTLAPEDPAPARSILFGIYLADIAGRSAREHDRSRRIRSPA